MTNKYIFLFTKIGIEKIRKERKKRSSFFASLLSSLAIPSFNDFSLI